MWTKAEQWQMQVQEICDHLIDRDDYFQLGGDEISAFLEWAAKHWHDFSDVDGLEIDAMFNKWLSGNVSKAA